MKLLDVNLLLHAVDEDAALHPRAKPWVEAVIGGRETVALPWVVLLAFLRLTTKGSVMTRPLAVGDAHPAALAIEHGAELCSHDRDFGRFTGLRFHDPLAR